MKTYLPPVNEIERKWYLVDADDRVLGRLASRLATILMGLMANYPVALAPAMGNNGFFRCHCLWCYGIFVASGPESRFHIRCTVPVADHTERLGHYH